VTRDGRLGERCTSVKNKRVDKREEVEIAVVDMARWPDLERLFESRGGPKGCWCMVWRPMPERPQRSDGQSRKRALKSRVQSGQPVGTLGVPGRRTHSVVSVAPRLWEVS
jgi:hypothetical protein